MDPFISLLEEFIIKAIVTTEKALTSDIKDVGLEEFTNNRERLFTVINQISEKIRWEIIPDEKKNELNKKIEYIKKMDEELLVKLEAHKQELQKDIEKTFRQKENIKGYNLNDVK